jgi:hypothetical protein
MDPATVPLRAETLQVLRLISDFEPLLLLRGDDDGYGSRWTLSGQQVQPAIAQFLMEFGFVADIGKTEFGAIKLSLTDKGSEFRERGICWWSGLSTLQKIKITVFG